MQVISGGIKSDALFRKNFWESSFLFARISVGFFEIPEGCSENFRDAAGVSKDAFNVVGPCFRFRRSFREFRSASAKLSQLCGVFSLLRSVDDIVATPLPFWKNFSALLRKSFTAAALEKHLPLFREMLFCVLAPRCRENFLGHQENFSSLSPTSLRFPCSSVEEFREFFLLLRACLRNISLPDDFRGVLHKNIEKRREETGEIWHIPYIYGILYAVHQIEFDGGCP